MKSAENVVKKSEQAEKILVSIQQCEKCKIDKKRENALRSSKHSSNPIASKSNSSNRYSLKLRSPIKMSLNKSKLWTRHSKCSSVPRREVSRPRNSLVPPSSSEADHSNAPSTVMSKHRVDHDNTIQGPRKVTLKNEDKDQAQDRSNHSKVVRYMVFIFGSQKVCKYDMFWVVY